MEKVLPNKRQPSSELLPPSSEENVNKDVQPVFTVDDILFDQARQRLLHSGSGP
jgi:hypothetical protein